MSIAQHNLILEGSDRPTRKMQDELHLIADAVQVLISHIDLKERYVFNNHAYEEWFGLRREQIHGRTVREVLGDDIYKQVGPHLHAALAGNQQIFETIVHDSSGEKHKMLVNYIPHFNGSGSVEGV